MTPREKEIEDKGGIDRVNMATRNKESGWEEHAGVSTKSMGDYTFFSNDSHRENEIED